MTHDQLTGKYARLQSELDAAYAEPAWSACRTGRIDRITADIAEVERQLASGAYRRACHADSSVFTALDASYRPA